MSSLAGIYLIFFLGLIHLPTQRNLVPFTQEPQPAMPSLPMFHICQPPVNVKYTKASQLALITYHWAT